MDSTRWTFLLPATALAALSFIGCLWTCTRYWDEGTLRTSSILPTSTSAPFLRRPNAERRESTYSLFSFLTRYPGVIPRNDTVPGTSGMSQSIILHSAVIAPE